MLIKIPFLYINLPQRYVYTCCLLLTVMKPTVHAQHTSLSTGTHKSIEKVPDTDLSRALLGGPTGSSAADNEAVITYIENMLAKYGTHDPWAGRAFYNIGMGHWHLGNYQDVLADFESCIKLPEPYSGIHLNAQQMRMMTLQQMGDYNGAIKASYDLLKTDGPNYEKSRYQSTALLLRAQWQSIFQKKEGMKNAAASYQAFLQYKQKNPSPTADRYSSFALRALGGALQKSQQGDQAVKIYDEYLRKYSKSLDAIKVAMDRLAIIYGGETKIPTDKLEEICSVYPINSGYGIQVIYQLGTNYFITSQYQSASIALRKAWHIVADKGDTSYSVDLSGEAALLEIRCLNLASMFSERDMIAKEIISHFKGTKYAQEAERILKSYHADTNTFTGAGTSVLVKKI